MKVLFKAVVLATAISAFAFVLKARHADLLETPAFAGNDGAGPGGP